MTIKELARDLDHMIDALQTLRNMDQGSDTAGAFTVARHYLKKVESDPGLSDRVEEAFRRGGPVEAAWILSGAMSKLTKQLLDSLPE
jgi:hypothetical protein